MRFYIDQMILWLKDKKEPRILKFEEDKINVLGNAHKLNNTNDQLMRISFYY